MTDAAGEADGRFERLFADYREPILSYLYRLTGDAAAAEELCQDVFLRAYRALPRLPADANTRAWLYRIATNRATDRHRRQRLLQWLPLQSRDALQEAAFPDPEGTVVEEQAVQRALAALPLKYRRVLVLFSVQGYAIREVAEMVGASEGAVKTQLCRARSMFRDAYGGEDSDAL